MKPATPPTASLPSTTREVPSTSPQVSTTTKPLTVKPPVTAKPRPPITTPEKPTGKVNCTSRFMDLFSILSDIPCWSAKRTWLEKKWRGGENLSAKKEDRGQGAVEGGKGNPPSPLGTFPPSLSVFSPCCALCSNPPYSCPVFFLRQQCRLTFHAKVTNFTNDDLLSSSV